MLTIDTRVIINKKYWKMLCELDNSKAKKVLNHGFIYSAPDVTEVSHSWKTELEEDGEKLYKWCISNTVELVYIEAQYSSSGSYTGEFYIFFESVQDATLFKLTFG